MNASAFLGRLTSGHVARHSLVSLPLRLTGLALSFVQAVLTARILGAEGYGIASVAMSAVQIAATLSVLGFGSLAVRELAGLRAAGSALTIAQFVWSSARRVALLATFAGGALSAAALAGLVPDAYHGAVIASGLVVLPAAAIQLQRGIAQGLGRIATAQVPGELLRPGLLVAFLLFAAATQLPLAPSHYVLAFAAAAGVAVAIALPFTLRGIGPARPPADLSLRRRWLTEARPFIGIMMVAILLGEIATLMLGWLAGPREAGLFQPVARIVPLMVLPAQVVSASFAPRVAELWARGERARVMRLTHTFTLITSAMTLAVVGLLILAAPLIMRLYGAEFLPSAALLWIVGLAQLLNAAAGPVGQLMTMTGHAGNALRGQLAALAVNLLLGIVLIPSQGAQGAAIAMAGGLAVWNLVLLARARQLLGFDPSLLGALARVWRR